MTTQFDQEEALDLLIDAQDHMRSAIESLRQYVKLTHDRHTEAYILDRLTIMTTRDHGFMGNDRNLDDLISEFEKLPN